MKLSRKASNFSALFGLGLIFSLVQAPNASANFTASLSINSVAVTGASNSTSPAGLPLPSDNLIDAADSLRVTISGVTSGSTVAVSTSNSFIVGNLSTNLNAVRTTDGVTSANINVGTGTTAEFFVFTRSTSLGSFTISTGGASNTYYVKGNSAGPAYNLEVTVGSNNYTSTIASLPIKVTDVFGNPVTGVTPTVSAIGLSSSSPLATDANGVTQTSITYPSTPGRAALQISVTASAVTGLPQPKNTFSTFIDVVSLPDLLAAEKAARAQDKTAADAALAAEKAARAQDKTAADAALAAEKAARAQDKTAADAALAAEKKISADALLAKAASDKSLAESKAALESQISQLNKSNQELSAQLSTLKNSVNLLTTRYNSLVKKYNTLAKKYKQPTIKG